MSQSQAGEKAANSGQDSKVVDSLSSNTNEKEPQINKTSWFKPCAIIVKSSSGPIFASAANLVPESKVLSTIFAHRSGDVEPCLGFSLDFSLGSDSQAANENKGFGVRHTCE